MPRGEPRSRQYHPIVAYDEALAERIRDRLGGAAGVTSTRMFGGLSFLTHGTLTVGVYGDDLLVRIDPDEQGEAVARPGVRPFVMKGRPTRGFVVVSGEDLDDSVLDAWIARAASYVATLPPKSAKPRSARR
jgi:TfoX/Sxy family transcriptional regulator of competence genes